MTHAIYFDDIEDLMLDATEEFESFLSLKELDFSQPTFNQDFECCEYGESYA